MIYGNSRAHSLLIESAAAEFLDPEVSQDVKDVVDDITDALTTNVETVDAEDKESNGVDLTAESCPVYKLAESRYGIDIRDIMRICEAAEEATGETPDAAEVATDVAETNDVDKDDLVIVAPIDVAQEIVEACIFEAKCGKSKGGKAKKKAKGLGKVLDDLKTGGFKIATKKGKKKGKK